MKTDTTELEEFEADFKAKGLEPPMCATEVSERFREWKMLRESKATPAQELTGKVKTVMYGAWPQPIVSYFEKEFLKGQQTFIAQYMSGDEIIMEIDYAK